ncbi:putative protein kinase [Gregarina niphandrodes]|uniref:Protein kinase domain-containing protein n=1 Tax=Gregarina niphandrodes TaxID=110365 RepID=A0A023BCW0_GRENI|nr:putative protein kinase [Gregarina niphandrodes]EZG85837.1 putative protein kinase [Gregarina niphandrodes]|eukprot:XP_011128814.1 putative protein kinase [Gregarina niphandrodes]
MGLEIPLPNGIPLNRRQKSILEEYDKLKEIGSGTYAKVFQLRHKKTGIVTAGKVLRPEHFPSNTENRVVMMFVNEIQLLAKSQCPGTVKLFNVEWSHDGILLNLEYVDGGTVWKEQVCPTPLLRWTHLVQLVQGVQHLHSQGVVHRDLKPTNILRTTNGLLRIADFGWAETINKLKSSNGEWPGTLEINPPEVLTFSGPLTERIDNYAVGMNFLLFISNRFVCRQKSVEVNAAANVILKMVSSLRTAKKTPPNFTVETWELFLGLTHPDPVQRWSLLQVCHHPWIVRNYLQFVSDRAASHTLDCVLWHEPTRKIFQSYRVVPPLPSHTPPSLLHRVFPRAFADHHHHRHRDKDEQQT